MTFPHPTNRIKMDKPLITAAVIIGLGVLIYFGLDTWQDSVTIYASTCETSSGRELPKPVCKWIENYRYEKDD
jgi:hypothetical protein